MSILCFVCHLCHLLNCSTWTKWIYSLHLHLLEHSTCSCHCTIFGQWCSAKSSKELSHSHFGWAVWTYQRVWGHPVCKTDLLMKKYDEEVMHFHQILAVPPKRDYWLTPFWHYAFDFVTILRPVREPCTHLLRGLHCLQWHMWEMPSSWKISPSFDIFAPFRSFSQFHFTVVSCTYSCL